ncbi:sorting nexin-8 isoform X4 [Zalophus californianus]|uniref:Sorting nexin-8 isoform X4 n=1 Tax=Zalophus californianus TaxID=9704 RepID=A0A6J2ECX3_ZALCA|nr:sorting nexin-8 isoform X4 [Zalophus californianus]
MLPWMFVYRSLCGHPCSRLRLAHAPGQRAEGPTPQSNADAAGEPAAAVIHPAGATGQGHCAGGAHSRKEGPFPEACGIRGFQPADREFIEARRRALRRFINLVARHPPFSEDVALRLFLSFSGPDVQNKLKESAQYVGDEFMNCKLAPRAKDFLPADIQTQLAVSRELIRNIYNSFHKLRDRAERIASRAIDNAADLLIFGKELSALGSDTTPLPSWASLNSSTWGSLKQALRGLSVEFALLADKAAQQGKQEENDVVEKLNLFLDLLQSYKELCERHEKGVLHKHQRALHKYSLTRRQMLSTTVQSREPDAAEQLESRIVEQENAIQTLELRSYFSLYCLHQEMQLVHVYLPLTSHILGAFVNSQIQGHKEMSKVWNDLKPKLSCLFAGPNSSLTPPRPLEDGVSPQ